ncbi:hypothetical protein [Microbacterium sp. HJ5]
MTNDRVEGFAAKKPKRSRGRKALIAAALSVALAASGASAAHAQEHWPSNPISCPSGKYAQLKIYTSGGAVPIGYGSDGIDASYGAYYLLNKTGWHVLNFGRTYVVWKKWISQGVAGSWTESCVAYH